VVTIRLDDLKFEQMSSVDSTNPISKGYFESDFV
jgi:hypothetical protein